MRKKEKKRSSRSARRRGFVDSRAHTLRFAAGADCEFELFIHPEVGASDGYDGHVLVVVFGPV